MGIQLESLSTGLAWERGEWWLLPGWVWFILAHFLCCLNLCKAVFEPRGSGPIQAAFWGHCGHEMTGPQHSSSAFKGMHSVHWSHGTPWPGPVACTQHVWVPISALWPHASPSPCPPSPHCPSLWWSGLCWLSQRVNKASAHLPTWIHMCKHGWSLPYNTIPRDLAHMQPGTVCICQDLGKRKVQNAVLVQHHLPALLAVSNGK